MHFLQKIQQNIIRRIPSHHNQPTICYNCLLHVQIREGKNEIQTHAQTQQSALPGFGPPQGRMDRAGQGHQGRGKYERIFTTQPFKRKELKTNKEPQTIPMTLFYDADTKRFLEKILQIEATIRNELDETEVELGSANLNVLNYLKQEKGEQLLQIKLYGQDEKQTIVKFSVLIEKEEEDNKSIKTSETYQSSENGDAANNKKYYTANTPNYKVEPCSPSQNSSQKNWSHKASKPPKYPNKQERPSPKQEHTYSKKYEQSYNEYSERNEPKRQKTASRREKSAQKSKTETQIVKKQSKQQRQGAELRLFLAEKQLKQKERLLQAAKRTIQAQNAIIAKYQQQKSKSFKSSQTLKHLTEIQSLKGQLLRANLKISELQTTNRNLESSEKEHVRLIDTKTKQANYYKEMLQNTKIRIGNLMQRCFEAKEFDFMAVIEEELQDN